MFGEKWLLLSQMLRDVHKDLSLWGKERGARCHSFSIILGCLGFFLLLLVHCLMVAGWQLQVPTSCLTQQHSSLEQGSRVRQKKHFPEALPLPADFPSHLNGQIWITCPLLKQSLEKRNGVTALASPWGWKKTTRSEPIATE